jgi:hypothetical protein
MAFLKPGFEWRRRGDPRPLLAPLFGVQVERREIGDLHRLFLLRPEILVSGVDGRFVIAASVQLAAADVLIAIRIDSRGLFDRSGEILRHRDEFPAHVRELGDEAPTPLGET